MTFIQSLILAFVQGLTEFLPVSSSGHLNLFQHLFSLTPSLSLDIFLNTATLLSVLVFFRHQLKFFFSHLVAIIIASIPAAIIGLFFSDTVDAIFSNFWILPIFFILNSFILYSTKNRHGKTDDFSLKQAFIIGLSQSLAILPGISRSGTTIATALALGLSPATAFSFSFSLFIPASFGAIVLALRHAQISSFLAPQSLVAFFFTFVVGLFSLTLLQRFLKKGQIWYFSFYSLALGLGYLAFNLSFVKLF